MEDMEGMKRMEDMEGMGEIERNCVVVPEKLTLIPSNIDRPPSLRKKER